MQRRKLLIAESAEEFSTALTDLLADKYIVQTCREGNEALRLLGSFQPDVLLLDLMLPGLDGISLLCQATAAGMHPVVLATTSYTSDYVTQSVQRLGVGYLMLKPCDVKATAARLADLTGALQPAVPERSDSTTVIANLLLSLSVPTKLRGYLYLQTGVLELMRDPAQMITKELYPAIGAKCGTDAVRVERCIRSAIGAAWSIRDEQIWRLYFRAGSDGQLKRPTNGEFLTRISTWMLNNNGVEW